MINSRVSPVSPQWREAPGLVAAEPPGGQSELDPRAHRYGSRTVGDCRAVEPPPVAGVVHNLAIPRGAVEYRDHAKPRRSEVDQ